MRCLCHHVLLWVFAAVVLNALSLSSQSCAHHPGVSASVSQQWSSMRSVCHHDPFWCCISVAYVNV